MRTLPSFASFGPLLGAATLALSLLACGVVSSEMAADIDDSNPNGARGDDPLQNNGSNDAGTSPPSPDAGSQGGHPLCGNVATAECWPDDPRQEPICGNALAPVADGGIPGDEQPEDEDGGAEALPLACRVRAVEGSLQNQCVTAGTAAEGSACKEGADCGAGLDCVRQTADKDGTGTCRAYCCEGVCGSMNTNGDSGRFCDPARRTDDDARIPACLPIRACRLLGKDECAANETCAVVREIDGSTGCIETGSASVGASCDIEHCAAGLTCLGQVGTRTCFQLCSDSGAACPAGQECTWAPPAFREVGVGVCTGSAAQRAF